MSEQDFNAAVDRVARRFLASRGRVAARGKTAGEVRFIKDRGGDKNEWGWGTPGPSERQITSDYEFNPNRLKPLAQCLRGTLAALGHAMSAYTTFTKIKSANISPDGNLGGRGYIAKISEMRRQYMNVTEALSALSDTIYDEMNAPHWNPAVAEQSPREREEVREIMDDVEDIKGNPKEWAEGEEAEMDSNGAGEKQKRTASWRGREAAPSFWDHPSVFEKAARHLSQQFGVPFTVKEIKRLPSSEGEYGVGDDGRAYAFVPRTDPYSGSVVPSFFLTIDPSLMGEGFDFHLLGPHDTGLWDYWSRRFLDREDGIRVISSPDAWRWLHLPRYSDLWEIPSRTAAVDRLAVRFMTRGMT